VHAEEEQVVETVVVFVSCQKFGRKVDIVVIFVRERGGGRIHLTLKLNLVLRLKLSTKKLHANHPNHPKSWDKECIFTMGGGKSRREVSNKTKS